MKKARAAKIDIRSGAGRSAGRGGDGLLGVVVRWSAQGAASVIMAKMRFGSGVQDRAAHGLGPPVIVIAALVRLAKVEAIAIFPSARRFHEEPAHDRQWADHGGADRKAQREGGHATLPCAGRYVAIKLRALASVSGHTRRPFSNL